MKIWFYYARAGGGHVAPAAALATELQNLGPEKTETSLIDLADKSSVLFRSTLEDGYVYMTQQAPWLYTFIYEISKLPFIMRAEQWLSVFFAKETIKARLVIDRPQAVVATHFLVGPLRAALQELKLNIPIYVIVTDPFSPPPVWFLYKDLNYIVYSKAAKELARQAGVPANNIFDYPQILNHPVVPINADEAEVLKTSYGLDPGKKTVLLVGGANGLPRGKQALTTLLRSDIDAQYVVVCGTNWSLAEQMKKVVAGYPNKKVLILDYVKSLTELIALSDLVISKAGAGVVWEVLLSKKPLLMTHYIYGQEEGTMKFVVENRLGWYEEDSAAIEQRVRECLTNPAVTQAVQDNADQLRLRSGTKEIALHIFRDVSARML